MDLSAIFKVSGDIFKAATPFIILMITALVIPILKRGNELRKTFFELPTGVKIEAIDYILAYKHTQHPLKSLSHKIKMEGYKLDKDVDFSSKVIKFYYSNRSKNSRFCRNLLKSRGMYSVDKVKIAFKPVMLFFLVIFSVLAFVQFILAFRFYNPNVTGIINAIPSVSLVIGGVVYAGVVLLITYQCIIIGFSKKRFNEFKENLSTEEDKLK